MMLMTLKQTTVRCFTLLQLPLLTVTLISFSRAQAQDNHDHVAPQDSIHAQQGNAKPEAHEKGIEVEEEIGEKLPKMEKKIFQPAQRYSGSIPIDLSNGIPFNNGTYGIRNPDYESFAHELVIPGVSAKQYSYESKGEFIRALEESVLFAKTAVFNWEHAKTQKPEVVEYGKLAVQTMRPKLDALETAIKSASKSGSSDWDKAQANARQALIDLRATYWSMHKNVRR